MLTSENQRSKIPKDAPDSTMFYGTVTGGNFNQGYNCLMDVLKDCDEGQRFLVVKRKNLGVVAKGAEEPVHDAKTWEALQAQNLEATDNRRSPETKSEDDFVRMESNILQTTSSFSCTYHPQEPPIVWKIYGDQEYIHHDAKYTRIKDHSAPVLSNVDFGKTPHENFFEHVWPDMKGSAAIVDEYLSNPLAEFHHTYAAKGIKFHDPTADDPDWKTKQCILVMISAASEVENGMACWDAGPGLGLKDAPDFGKWMPKDEMKCFMSCAAFIWADKEWWFCNRRDVDWDAFMPTINAWNFARTKLCVTFLLMLDESMSGWKPKCSKRGGLPNITYEPRKPVDLGTMLRNAAECHTGILMHIDPVMSPERQGHKEYVRTLNYLPRAAGSSTREVSMFVWRMLIDAASQFNLSVSRSTS